MKLLNDDLKRVLDLLGDGILITDQNLIIQYVNEAYKETHSDDRIGKYLPDVRPTSMLPQAMERRKPLLDMPRKAGSFESYCDYIPIMQDEQILGGLIVIRDVVRIKRYLDELKARDEKISQLDERINLTFKARFRFEDILGRNSGLKQVIDMCHKATHTDSPVLLIGESGTGKEMLAQSIHNESDRRDFPFADVNCAALPETLLESELFGYVEGAFTGAKKKGKMGLFEIANGGTLFLDEISEMPPNLQTKLLRVLQEKKLRRIGAETNTSLNTRIIAATNKNIDCLLEEGKFRKDLYFRLAVFVVNLPALRDRKGDIKLFINEFVDEEQRKKRMPIAVHDQALQILQHYHWPGNVRELKNAIEYACNVIDSNTIEMRDLPRNIVKNSIQGNTPQEWKKGVSLDLIMGKAEKEILEKYLMLYGQSVEAKRKVADELQISIATLYSKLRKHQLK
jgi:transcriptional regulator with PAS, ATPase and Fis domain